MAGRSELNTIQRRTVLRGAGVALALPWLEAMLPRPAKASAAATVSAPVRFGCLFFPNGVWQDTWIPKKSGAEFELPFALEPLEKHKKQVTVLSCLDKAHSRSGDGHYAKTANFLTGLLVQKTTGKEIHCGGVSLDQLVAQRLAGKTPLPSLELGIDPVISGIDSNVGYTRLYGSYISWRTPEIPVAKEINPRLVYERLFRSKLSAAKKPAAGAESAERAKLLDLVLEDAKGLRKKLGRDDQFKLDEYLDSVHAVEKRIDFYNQSGARGWKPGKTELPPAPAGVPHDYVEHVKLMLDMMFLAFWTDSTRVCTFMFANDVSGRNFSFVDGVKGAHHELSHHENKAEKIEQYKRINRWHTAQFAYLLDRMAAVKEGERTLLANSMLMLGCGMSDGNRHDPNNLPIVLAGEGGGTIQAGRHIQSKPNTPLCNLYLSILERMGVSDVERFGDSNAKLALS